MVTFAGAAFFTVASVFLFYASFDVTFAAAASSSMAAFPSNPPSPRLSSSHLRPPLKLPFSVVAAFYLRLFAVTTSSSNAASAISKFLKPSTIYRSFRQKFICSSQLPALYNILVTVGIHQQPQGKGATKDQEQSKSEFMYGRFRRGEARVTQARHRIT